MKPGPRENCDSWIHDVPLRPRETGDGIRYHLETDDERQLRLEEREAFSTPDWITVGL